MAILTLQDVGKYVGHEQLFSGVSFLINEGERMALVGPNGAGKTTLLKGIAGLTELEEGRVSVAPGARVAYLSQDPDLVPERTVLEEAESAFGHLKRWEVQLRSLEEKMGSTAPGPALDELMADYGRLSVRYEVAGGYEAGTRVRAVLFGLGFQEEQLSLPTRVLSGGQKVRVGLAKLLLSAPDLMMLDEPTNHLDLAAVEWLEGYLKQVRASALVVSHDRYFLDHVVGRVLELERGAVHMYHGNYSHYLTAREQRLHQQAEEWGRLQDEAEKLRSYIRKYGAGNRATQAHDRERKLERLESRMQGADRPVQRQNMKLHLAQDIQSGEDVLKLDGLTKAYGDRLLFTGVNLEVVRGERVALLGANGVGKTTLLRTIHGEVSPTAGSYWWGVGVQRAYFSQELNQLDGRGTVLDELLGLPGMTIFAARSLLARFLFRGDDMVNRPVAALSGGERNRLTLCKLVLSGANVLLLDEPTNHLDLESKQVLEEALLSFPGTLFFVSHDRYFVDQVATKVWEVDQGKIAVYPGGYSDYRQAREQAQVAVEAARPTETAAPRMAPQRAEERARGKEQRKVQAELRRLEDTITRLEERKRDLEQVLADPETYRGPRGRELTAEYQAVERELERLYVEWEAAAQ